LETLKFWRKGRCILGNFAIVDDVTLFLRPELIFAVKENIKMAKFWCVII
jgi:hypothetical protein